MTSRDAQADSDEAVAILKKAVGMGYNSANSFRDEPALDSLRGRPDFQVLMMDLNFPAEPIADGG